MQNIQNSTSPVYYSNNGTHAISFNLEGILKSAGDSGISSSCTQILSQDCGFAVGSYLAYQIPKRTVESLASWALWTVKQIGKGVEQTTHTALTTTQTLATHIYSAPTTIEKIDNIGPQIQGIFNKIVDSPNKVTEIPEDLQKVVTQILPSEKEASDALHNVTQIFTPFSQPINAKKEFIYEKSEEYYRSAVNLADTLSSQLTSWVTGKPNGQSAQHQAPDATSDDSFRAIDLIGPTLFLAFCAHQTFKHLNKAYTNTKTLLSSSRISANVYQVKARNHVVVVANTKHHTTPKLVRDALMHTAFAGVAGAAAYCAYNGIYDNLAKASGNAAHATQCALTISVISTLAPNIFKWCKTQVRKKLTSHGSPVSAPQLFYTHPAEEIKQPLVGRHPETNLARLALRRSVH